jgi:hypothetical protein
MRKAMQARSEEDLHSLNEIFENEIVQQATFANSPDSHFIFFTLRLHHFQLTNQLDKFYAEAKDAVDYIKLQGTENFPAMQVLWAYAQLTQACYFTRQWQLLKNYLEELKSVEITNTTEKTAQFTYYTQLAITLYDFKQDKKLLTLTLNEAISNLMLFKNRLRPDIRLSITLTCVSALVEYGYYSKAVDLCEDFLTNYDTGIRLDALLMLYVYEFICHLEMGNTLYINNTIQNVYRYFLRHDYKGAFESKLMLVFKKISEIHNYSSHRKEIEKLKEELNEAGENAANHQHLALMPLVQNFLDAKLVNEKIHVFLAAQKQKG